MTPDEVATVDQFRAKIAEALVTPCVCGNCTSDDDLRVLQTMTDRQLLALLRIAGD